MNTKIPMNIQLFASNVTTGAETNLIGKTEMAKVREVDFVNKFTHGSLAKLIEVLGVTRKIPMQEGTTMYTYVTTGTLESGAVPEGEIIPLSKYKREKKPVGEITLNKWRKATSAEAIMKSGYQEAVRETDNKLVNDVQKTIRTDFFTLLNGFVVAAQAAVGTEGQEGYKPAVEAVGTSVSGTTLQSVLADSWAQLQILFEDDAAAPVHFINPLDIADYLKSGTIITQTAFGMNYVEDFLGLGTVIMTSRVTQGTVISTAKENLVMYYLTMGGDIANKFGLTTDELGYIGINVDIPTHDRMQLETLVATGIQFFVEYAAGVVKGTITGA